MHEAMRILQQAERLRLEAQRDAQRTRKLLRRTAQQIKKSVNLLANHPPPPTRSTARPTGEKAPTDCVKFCGKDREG